MTTREEAQILAASLEHVPAYLNEDRAILEDAAQLLRQWPEAGEPRQLLQQALERMDRARDILTDGKPRPECNWGLLATEDIRAQLAAPSQQPAPERNEWREAILDQLAAHAINAPKDEPPAAILRRIIDMAVTIALDPAVSSDAQALIDRGVAQAAPDTPVSGSTHGLSQDYNGKLGKWFADRPGARQQLREDMAQAAQSGMVPVAFCELTANGSIAYFDGKPMVMCGPVGNECHTVPLYAAPQAVPQPLTLDQRAMLRDAAHIINRAARTKGDHWDRVGSLLSSLADGITAKGEQP